MRMWIMSQKIMNIWKT